MRPSIRQVALRAAAKLPALALVACLGASPLAFASGAVFSLEDLQALDQQESWQELINHLSDLPPSQRNDAWSRILERAAVGLLGTADGIKGWDLSDALIRQYPVLKKDARFMDRRKEVALRGLEFCLREGVVTFCAEHALNSVEAEPGDGEFAFGAGQRISRTEPSSAVHLFRRALNVRHDAKRCSDESLAKAVNYGLSESPEDQRVADAQTIAFDSCWDQIKEAVIDVFISGGYSSNFRKNTCGFLLKKKGALSPLSTKQCEAIANSR